MWKRCVGGLVVFGTSVVTAGGCQPPYTTAPQAICADAGTYAKLESVGEVNLNQDIPGAPDLKVPAGSVELIQRLSRFDATLRITPRPVVTVTVGWNEIDRARRLRSEFGDAIDIQLGDSKRLAGGPGKGPTCLLRSPGTVQETRPWPYAKISTDMLTPTVRRGEQVRAAVRVQVPRKGKRTANVHAGSVDWNNNCSPEFNSLDRPDATLTRVADRVAVNLSVVDAWSQTRTPFGDPGYISLVGPHWRESFRTCLAVMRVPRGGWTSPTGEARFEVFAQTSSALAEEDPLLPGGYYFIRPLVRISVADGIAYTVEAPPALVHITD